MTDAPEGLRKMSGALTINRASLFNSFHDGDPSDWEMIKAVMAHLGYELKFVHVVFSPGSEGQASENIIPFPFSRKARAA